MIKVTVTGGAAVPERRRRTIAPLTILEIGALQEGQDLDFKREIAFEQSQAKARLLDDVVAFLNRGAARIIVGVEEKAGRFESFRPMAGDADKAALRIQTLIQDGITPLPVDVQVVPLHLENGFVLDIQIPHHHGAPFMNRLTGGYLIRSGARNLPIDPGMLRSRFVDETAWITRLDELTAAEDSRLAASGRIATGRVLRVAIISTTGANLLPRTTTSGHRGRAFTSIPGSGSGLARMGTKLSPLTCGSRASSGCSSATTGSSTLTSPMPFRSDRARAGWRSTSSTVTSSAISKRSENFSASKALWDRSQSRLRSSLWMRPNAFQPGFRELPLSGRSGRVLWPMWTIPPWSPTFCDG